MIDKPSVRSIQYEQHGCSAVHYASSDEVEEEIVYSRRDASLVEKGSAVTVASGEKLGKLKLIGSAVGAAVGNVVGLEWEGKRVRLYSLATT